MNYLLIHPPLLLIPPLPITIIASLPLIVIGDIGVAMLMPTLTRTRMLTLTKLSLQLMLRKNTSGSTMMRRFAQPAARTRSMGLWRRTPPPWMSMSTMMRWTPQTTKPNYRCRKVLRKVPRPTTLLEDSHSRLVCPFRYLMARTRRTLYTTDISINSSNNSNPSRLRSSLKANPNLTTLTRLNHNSKDNSKDNLRDNTSPSLSNHRCMASHR